MNDLNRIVGQRLRRAREAQHLSLRLLSTMTGVSFTAISGVERGCNARFSTVAALAAALNQSLDVLTSPSTCATCDGMPPAGFTCRECGTDGPEVTA